MVNCFGLAGLVSRQIEKGWKKNLACAFLMYNISSTAWCVLFLQKRRCFYFSKATLFFHQFDDLQTIFVNLEITKLAFSIMIRRWTNQTTATKLQMFRYHCCICLFAAFCVWILMNSGPTFSDEKLSTVGQPQSTFKILNLW